MTEGSIFFGKIKFIERKVESVKEIQQVPRLDDYTLDAYYEACYCYRYTWSRDSYNSKRHDGQNPDCGNSFWHIFIDSPLLAGTLFV